MSSVLASAATILLLYCIPLSCFGRKLLKAQVGEETHYQKIMLAGSGAVGALAFIFTDSFWFSAVEGEVYAMSSFLLLLSFWYA